MSQPSTLCSICSSPTSQSCGHCKKIFYCCKQHQKDHRKAHKEDCFPAVLFNDPVIGQYFVASREIREGEVIFNEYPIVSGPSGSLPTFRPICLGCFKFVAKSSYCSSCKWPVCDSLCEKEPCHAQLECPILKKNKIPPPTKPIQYQHIFVLRCLMQRQLQPKSWELLLTLESHVKERKMKKECAHATALFLQFLRLCNMNEFDVETVNYVYGAVQFNSYPLDRYLKGTGIGAQLYYKLGKLNHSCVENTNALDIEPKPGKTPVSRGLSLVACVQISKGQALTQLYGDTLQGTYSRQRFLESEYYFTCCCARCKDPYELGTNYSAVKCRNGKCAGYIVPTNPLESTSPWVCGGCSQSLDYKSKIEKVIEDISQEMKILHNEIQKGTNNLEQQMKLNDKLESFLLKYERTVVHPNHYTLVPIKLRNLQETHDIFTALISKIDFGKSKDLNLVESVNKMKTDIKKKIGMASDMLKVFDTLSPGNSHIRGLLHKFIQDYTDLLTNTKCIA